MKLFRSRLKRSERQPVLSPLQRSFSIAPSVTNESTLGCSRCLQRKRTSPQRRSSSPLICTVDGDVSW
eukprot:3173316-Amphidinium_carterae.1